MPKTPSTGWAHQPFLWKVANAGMLIECRCRRCERLRTYLAADLIGIFHPSAVVGELWGRCPRCGFSECWSEQERYAISADVGHTLIRRPSGFRKIQLWRNDYYGPPAYGPHKPFGPYG